MPGITDPRHQCDEQPCRVLRIPGISVMSSRINIGAANSLREGFEQTLTMQRIGMNKLFARSLGTTNRIEHLNRQMSMLTHNVTNWCTPDQRLRWASFASLTAERRRQ